jgi:hypothetical protein
MSEDGRSEAHFQAGMVDLKNVDTERNGDAELTNSME